MLKVKTCLRAGEMAQHLGACIALPEDLIQFLAPTLDGSQSPVTLAPRGYKPLWAHMHTRTSWLSLKVFLSNN